MNITLRRKGEPMLIAEFERPSDDPEIVFVAPHFAPTYSAWIEKEDYIMLHDDEGGYSGMSNGMDDARALGQRLLIFVHELGDGWDVDVEPQEAGTEKIAKHLPGQHDQLSHAGVRVAQGESDPARIAASKQEAAKVAERIITEAGEKFAKDVADFRARMKAGKQTRELHQKDGKYTEERQKLHKEIIDKIIGQTTTSEDPTFVLMGGLPGSGKSTIVRGKDYGNYIKIDSDFIKQQLPEYEGWNAGLLQLEADDIIGKVLVRAVQERKNVLLDGTLKTYNKADALVNRVAAFGYKIGVIFSEVSPEESMRRAVERYGRTGRLVDPMYIASHDHMNKATYEKLKVEVDFYELYDNNEREAPPKLKEKGHAQAR